MMMARMIISLREIASSRQSQPYPEASNEFSTNLQDDQSSRAVDDIPLPVLKLENGQV